MPKEAPGYLVNHHVHLRVHTHTHMYFRHTYKHKAYIAASDVTRVRAFPKASNMGSTARIFFLNIALPSAQVAISLVSGCGVVMVWRYSCRRVCVCNMYMLNRWAFGNKKHIPRGNL